ncbi:ABC transporter substrate-binding protein [Rhodococcus triatomae]|uniref:NitT/TauT family transport system substrate-binding protein n=1 Tax=Rhodococcus triatomae TaxID=300028 RepID=A0A1G8MB83_9NOCA|nr:ABC transporter substrate-binding protein [Rhodococcus triatomae]QNG18146.1 ABC transporter substrate-binding protein [Rhodococcus triatomae]QNG22184.1 ABC transporter substrate-binding protein [Rhodococcus triatomae]SDI65125.1 NitT/TauT family transport system substrate-binding protein [Rhodococcus triatomae]
MNRSLTRLLASTLGAAAALMSVVACTDAGPTDSSALTVGFVVDPSWAQIPVAAAEGFFDEHGVDVEVVNFQSGVEALQAVAAGQVDVATAADVPTSAVLTRSPSLRVIGDGSRWEGSRIVARRSAGITDVGDLAGASIGTPIGTSASYFAADVLHQNGIEAELVQVSPSAMVTAATQQNVDAVSIFQPYQAQVVAALGDDAVELAGGTYRQHSLYLATAAAVEDKSTALSAFFAALADAGAELTANSDSAVSAVASATQLDPDLLRSVLPQFDFALQLRPELAEKLDELGQWAQAQGSIDAGARIPDYQEFLEDRFLPDADR